MFILDDHILGVYNKYFFCYYKCIIWPFIITSFLRRVTITQCYYNQRSVIQVNSVTIITFCFNCANKSLMHDKEKKKKITDARDSMGRKRQKRSLKPGHTEKWLG